MISTAQIRSWIRHSDLESLEQTVLDGHGHALISENASDSKIRAFIKAVPSYMVKRDDGLPFCAFCTKALTSEIVISLNLPTKQ